MIIWLVGRAASMAGFFLGVPFFRMQILDCHTVRHQRQAVDLVSSFCREFKESRRHVIAA